MYTLDYFEFDSTHRFLFAYARRFGTPYRATFIFDGTSPCPYPTCISPGVTCKECLRKRENRQMKRGKLLYHAIYESRLNEEKPKFDINL